MRVKNKHILQANYSENIGKLIIDSIGIWPLMDMSLKKFGIDGLAFDAHVVSSGFVIEDCGDGVVPESDFIVRRSSVESPLWTCESSI